MKRRNWIAMGAMTCFLTITISACGRLPAVNQVNPTSVQIVRHIAIPSSMKALNVTVSNVNTVRKLYADISTLKTFTKGTTSCPADFGITYTLKFKSKNQVILTAVADPNGCRGIQLSTGKTLWGADDKGQAFFNDLAKALKLRSTSDLGGPQ